MSAPVWLITGASNGLGLALVLRVLAAGHKAVGSVRSKTKSAAAVDEIEKAGGSVIEMDMTESKDSITRKVQAVGSIDYLVNNAGYSLLAACELISEQEALLQMTTNVFGPLYTLQAALPGMRERKSGTIVNLSSVGARDPQPTCSLYAASKAALEATSEALALEVAPHNIRVLIVEPGGFRTNFLGPSAAKPDPSRVPAHYDDPVGVAMRKFAAADGKQPGDPAKAADRIFEVVTGEGLAGYLSGKVLHLVLGKDALDRIRARTNKYLEELKLQEETTMSTDHAS